MSIYTKELLEPIVETSISVAEVLRKLGKRQTGSVATHVSKVIKKLGIDTSHFLGQAANSGNRHKGGPNKKPWQKILVKTDKDTRIKSFILRRALIEAGRIYECAECKQGPKWRGKDLILQVNHRNGDWQDNQLHNLEFLCPNCHATTIGWSNNKGLTDVTKRRKRKMR